MVQQTEEVNGWTEIIRPDSRFGFYAIKSVWQYRDLLWMLVRRDFVANYKQTILGPIWFFIQPIFTTLIFTVVFGNIAGISTDGLPMMLFYLSGTVLWNYFAECFSRNATVFRDNASLFGKVYFPRVIVPLSIIVSNLVKLSIQLALFFAFWLYFKATGVPLTIGLNILLLPILILLLAIMGLGAGLIITSFTTKYRDLVFLITFGIQLLMYATPVIFPLSAVPVKYRVWVELNPLSAIIECFRFITTHSSSFEYSQLLYSALVSLVMLFLGVWLFAKTEKNFMDTV